MLCLETQGDLQVPRFSLLMQDLPPGPVSKSPSVSVACTHKTVPCAQLSRFRMRVFIHRASLLLVLSLRQSEHNSIGGRECWTLSHIMFASCHHCSLQGLSLHLVNTNAAPVVHETKVLADSLGMLAWGADTLLCGFFRRWRGHPPFLACHQFSRNF